MLLGEIPGLALDRTGVALLGALALVATERVTPAAAWAAVDVPTLALLFGLMVVSAQFRLGGFYTWVTRRIVSAPLGPSSTRAQSPCGAWPESTIRNITRRSFAACVWLSGP